LRVTLRQVSIPVEMHADEGVLRVSDDGGRHSTGSAGRPWLAVALVFLLALGVRLGYVLTLGDGLVWDDARHYDRTARNFLQGDGLILDEQHRVERPPLYPLLLAGIYLINYHLHLAGDVPLVRLVQVLMGAATVLLVWWTTRRLFGERSALCAALAAALYPFFIYYVGVLLSETLAVFLVALATAALVATWEERALHYPVAAGAALGLLCLTRSSFLLLPPLVVLVWLLVRRPRKRALLESALILVIWMAVLVPWVARNYLITHGRFVPGTLTAGWSLYEAAGPGADGGPRMERIQWPEEVWPREGSGLDEYRADRYLSRLTLEYVGRHRAEAVRLGLKKLARLWNVVPNFSGYRSPVYLAVSVLGYLPVMVLALVGAVAHRRSWRRWCVLLVPAVYLSGIHAVFVGSIRYRVPAMVGLVVLAGAGAAVVLGRRWRKGSGATAGRGGGRRRLWVLLAVLALLVVVLVVGKRVLLPADWRVEARLRDELVRLWGAPVTIGQAAFGALSGLEAREVVLYSAEDPQRAILKVTRLEASLEKGSLARGRLVLREVDIKGGELLLRHTPRGWDLPKELLGSRPWTGARPPRIVVRGLQLRFQEQTPAGRRETELGLLNLHARSQADGTFRMDFRLRGEVLGGWRGQATVSGKGDKMALSALCDEFRFTPEALGSLPVAVERVLRKFAPQGNTSLEVSAEVPLNGQGSSQVAVGFAGASLAYHKFAYRIPWTRGVVRLADGVATVTEAEGRDGETRVRLSGTVSLPGRPKRVALRLEATKGRLNEELRDCLPERYHRLWNDLRLAGTVNVTARLTADKGTQGRTELALDIRPTDCTVDYVRFPYPVRLASGSAHYGGGRLRAEGLRGETPAGVPVTISGTVADLDTPRAHPRILIEAPRRPLDDGLRRALAPQYRELWDRLQPEGAVAARCLVARGDDGEGPVGVEVTAQLLGASITDREFPYRLSDLRGRLTLTDAALVLEDVKGTHGPAQVSLSGRLLAGSPTRLDLTLNGVQLPLDQDLKRALPESVQEVWSTLNLAGTVTVNCKLSGDPESLKKTINIATNNGRLRYEGFPYPLRNLTGELDYEDGRLQWDLKTREGDEATGVTISTSGLAKGLPDRPEVNWGVVAKNVELDETLIRAISGQPLIGRFWRLVEVKPGAKGNLSCSLAYRDGAMVLEWAEVELTEAAGLFRPLPYPFDQVTGKIIYEDGTLTLENLRGERAGAVVRVDRGRIDNLAGEPSFELVLSAENLPLDEHLRALLPPAQQDLWDRMAPSGYLSFPKDNITVSGGPTGDAERVITYHGNLRFRDVAFTLGLEFKEVTGKLSLAGQLVSRREVELEAPGGSLKGADESPHRVVSHRCRGTGRLTRLVASGKPLTNVTLSFLKEGSLLGFSTVEADIYGGRLAGAVRLGLEPEEVTYGCRLHLDGLDLGPFVRDTFAYRGEELVGTLAGDVVLQGVGPGRRDLVGQGTLTIVDGELYQMPLILRILSLLQLSVPREAAFSRAAIDYYVIEQELVINELDLWGRGLNIFGSGRVTPANDLDLTLFSGFGRGYLPHVPLLSDAVELLGKQLVRLRVAGTFTEPAVTVEPLSPLSGPLFDMFRMLTRQRLTEPAEQP